MAHITLKAPAKLNLYLNVLNKRPDGFHSIKTVFERINLVDRVRIKTNKTGAIRVSCNHPQVPTGPKNLVYQVARKLQQQYCVGQGVDIHINKSIPVAAGLAGGSTNAASTLLGLNRLWQLNLNFSQLLSIGRAIGSDVPFFLYETSWAMGTERGDKVRPLKIDRKLWHILVVPRLKMYTRKVYGRIRITNKDNVSTNAVFDGTNVLTKKRDDANILVHKLRNGNIISISSLLYNDLEKVVVQISPKVSNVIARLKSLDAKGVTVSGSGPSVYGLTDSEKEAKQIQSELLKKYSQVFVVRTL